MSERILQFSNLPDVKFFKKGKVRDIYDLGTQLLIISSDRISCFDVTLPSGIPCKGEVLTKLSTFWFKWTKDIIANHLISANIKEFPKNLLRYKEILEGRSMLVQKTEPILIECVVRGYLAGSSWKEYKQKQTICGIKLPKGLKESTKLPQPIFTPSTKEDKEHDVNVTQEYIEKEVGKNIATKLKNISLTLYKKASKYAESKGIIIADTKFEFGFLNNEIILIDELFTPDSSRFWPKDKYSSGKSQPSFDKQFVRDYLETLNWNKTPPAPLLPDEIVKKTSDKYLQALEILTND